MDDREIRLTEDDIRRLADETSFVRGMGYLTEGRLSGAHLSGKTLRARCIGSMGTDYEQELVLGEGGISSYRCTCPRGGFCKHLAALALRYVREPGRIVRADRERLESALAEHSREDLLRIIAEYAEEDLNFAQHVLAETESDGGAPERENVSFGESRREFLTLAEQTVEIPFGNPYHAAFDVAAQLKRLLFRADRLAGDAPARHLAFYTAIYETVEEHFTEVDDSDAALASVAAECARSMAQIGEDHAVDPETREAWLEIIVPRYIENDYGFGDELGDAILSISGKADIELVETLVRESLPQRPSHAERSLSDELETADFLERYRRQIAYELLAGLYRRVGRHSEIGPLFRNAGLHFHYVVHLLAEGATDEAVRYATDHLRKGYDIHRFGTSLSEMGATQQAIRFYAAAVPAMKEREPYRHDCMSNLARLYRSSGQPEAALDLQWSVFRERPSVESYKAVYEIAQSLNRADDIERQMLDYLENEEIRRTVLIDIHIHRRDIDEALAVYRRETRPVSEETSLRLARAAKAQRPNAAREIYQGLAEEYIGRMGRGNYRRAAGHLVSMRDVSAPEEFSAYLTELRQRYRNRPALRDEIWQALGE